MYSLLNVQAYSHITVIEINHPPANALSSKLADELFHCFQSLCDDTSVHVVVLRGAGQKFFIAGADIKEFPNWIGSTTLQESVEKNHRVINFIENFPKPTIAFLNGLTLGGGLEVALAFDFRYAEAHSKLGVPEVNLGIFPGAGGTQRLPKLIGKAKALEMMYLGEPISADHALKIGLVNNVFNSGEGFEQVLNIAQEISKKSTQVFNHIKQAVLQGMETDLETGLQIEQKLFIDIFNHPDAAEGINAFIEKREPKFN
ncbi:enoyl-CoA hydratase/isomerase family protein [Lysinibacillus odysseyi]|uniref:enoyl-CoA hydratase/isomerase family protein n=1 Tax=Lysinibacillus odysseyi TaxID=202611 RepID=UPI000A932B0A|nr:enoyl-CoA hydratase-related protein [Lysinibacillus odysseyi]